MGRKPCWVAVGRITRRGVVSVNNQGRPSLSLSLLSNQSQWGRDVQRVTDSSKAKGAQLAWVERRFCLGLELFGGEMHNELQEAISLRQLKRSI